MRYPLSQRLPSVGRWYFCVLFVLWAMGRRDELIRRLSALIGDVFQDAVCRSLAKTFLDFQRIPPRPQGDGGLDGLSNNLTTAYCCYGLEPVSIATAAKARTATVKKFRKDLQRILEVKATRTGIVDSPNNQLGGILASRRIKLIRLVCNHFEDRRVIGDLQKAFDEYKAGSNLRYVESACSLTIWGPRDVVDNCVVDELVLYHAEQPVVAQIIEAAEISGGLQPASTSDFDAKFDELRSITPSTKQAAVDSLRGIFLRDWARCLEVMDKLNNDEPLAFKALSGLVESAVTTATMHSLTALPADAHTLVGKIRDLLTEAIKRDLDRFFPGNVAERVAVLQAARLVGECPINWRSK